MLPKIIKKTRDIESKNLKLLFFHSVIHQIFTERLQGVMVTVVKENRHKLLHEASIRMDRLKMELFVYKSYLSQDTEKQNLIQQWVCKDFYPVTVCSALDWRQPYY